VVYTVKGKPSRSYIVLEGLLRASKSIFPEPLRPGLLQTAKTAVNNSPLSITPLPPVTAVTPVTFCSPGSLHLHSRALPPLYPSLESD
jgi:hypothetical protein